MDINLKAENVRVETWTSRELHLEIEGVSKTDLLDNLNMDDFINHFGYEKILDAIGVEDCQSYFGLTEE